MVNYILGNTQREATNWHGGRLQVLAGPGSGKTTVVTECFVNLVEQTRVPANDILCLTFSRSAADEMRNRISARLNSGESPINIFDFHAFGWSFLSRELSGLYGGYENGFTVLGRTYTSADNNYSKVGFIQYDDMLVSQVEQFKKTHPDDAARYLLVGNEDLLPEYVESRVRRFLVSQRQGRILDFSDLLLLTDYILNNNERIRVKWQNLYRYIIVDEFQDTDKFQYELVEILSRIHGNLMIVGDPNQSIYDWRGLCNPDLSGFETLTLDNNYRSTPEIVACANRLLAHSGNSNKSLMKAVSPSGNEVAYCHCLNTDLSTDYIIEQINKIKTDSDDYSDFAILFRNNKLLERYRIALDNKNLPVLASDPKDDYFFEGVKDIVAVLRSVLGDIKTADAAFRQICNKPSRRFGDKKVEILARIAQDDSTALSAALLNHRDMKEFKKYEQFINMLDFIKVNSGLLPLSELASFVVRESGLPALYPKTEQQAIQEFCEMIKSFEVENNISSYSSAKEIYIRSFRSYYSEHINRVRLMTVHASKGLEFKSVFVVGASEGVLPARKTLDNSGFEGVEAERRLMYVAVTRARQNLFIISADDDGGYSPWCRSRFIGEMGLG